MAFNSEEKTKGKIRDMVGTYAELNAFFAKFRRENLIPIGDKNGKKETR